MPAATRRPAQPVHDIRGRFRQTVRVLVHVDPESFGQPRTHAFQLPQCRNQRRPIGDARGDAVGVKFVCPGENHCPRVQPRPVPVHEPHGGGADRNGESARGGLLHPLEHIAPGAMEPVDPAAAPRVTRGLVRELMSEDGTQLVGCEHVHERQTQLQNRPRPAEEPQPRELANAGVEIHQDADIVERPALQLAPQRVQQLPECRRLGRRQRPPFELGRIEAQKDNGLRDREQDHEGPRDQQPDTDLEREHDAPHECGHTDEQ